MPERYDLVVTNGEVVSHSGRARFDIGIRDGRFAAFGDLARADASERYDATGLTVLPGVIDTQVHFREPGAPNKETLASGSRGAVLGGVVAVFEMPNTDPLTTTPEALADKLSRATGMWCDHAFYMGATGENAEQLGELERLPGCCGVKIFMGSSTGNLLTEDDETLSRILSNLNRRCAVHAEDEPRLKERKHLAEAEGHPRAHPVWRDVETALTATRRLLALARQHGKRVHVLHITTAEEMEFLAANRDLASVEVTPQHLTLDAADYERIGTRAQMNPPVREAAHREALWRAVRDGVVDVLGSDHAPHTLEEKAQPYPNSPSGMTGVQTLLPIMLDHVANGRLTLERLVDLTSLGPQRLFQLAGKGRIARGYDADLTLVDLKAKWTIEDSWIASQAGWTPFHGKQITGKPLGTVIRGNVVVRDGALQGDALGQPMRFQETLPRN
ncbi:MAG: dihydroorotase [Alphaproteobacteria bacterium]